jgi:uncharacterized protein (DUF3084 family)
MNLTIMRSVYFGNLLKEQLVRMLMSAARPTPITLERRFRFTPRAIEILDKITARIPMTVRWLEFGRPFVGTHMASAGYVVGTRISAPSRARRITVANGVIREPLEVTTTIVADA